MMFILYFRPLWDATLTLNSEYGWSGIVTRFGKLPMLLESTPLTFST
jgi:hypothetical protein